MQVGYAAVGNDLIPAAFPALTSLSLKTCHLNDGAIFSHLAKHSLTSLSLCNCHMDEEATPSVAAALAQLPCLRALELDGNVHIATSITNLTSLDVCTHPACIDTLLTRVLPNNPQLGTLSVTHTGYPPTLLQPDMVSSALLSCTNLTTLKLHSSLALDDDGLSQLLLHGTSITELELGTTALTASKADWACSWKKLTIYNRLQELAFLPLATVDQLVTHTHLGPSALRYLCLPQDVPPAELPALLGQACHNLASCSACTRAPPPQLVLRGNAAALTQEQRLQLLHALTPLQPWRMTGFQLDIAMTLGAAEVETLASALPHSLTFLELNSITLLDPCWRSFSDHLPGLQTLSLGSQLATSALNAAMYLAHRQKTAPHCLQLHIRTDTFSDDYSGTRLLQSIHLWSLPNVSLHVHDAEEPYL
jgi:hypothetical protein